jgi:ADP-heptose:LPS heptosyltransferase
VIANDAIGNFVVVTPLLKLLRQEWFPSELVYFGGKRTAELESASPLIDRSLDHLGVAPRDVVSQLVREQPFDVVVNVESGPWSKSLAAMLCAASTIVFGPCMDGEGRADLPFPDDAPGRLGKDQDWCAEDLCERHPILRHGHISEILCRATGLTGAVPSYEVPEQAPGLVVPDVLVATAASAAEKLWGGEQWRILLERFRSEGLEVGLLGAPPREQTRFWKGGEEEDRWVQTGLIQDLRGRLTLPQVVGALRRASLIVSLDNGVLHLAAATRTPIVGLFRHGIHRLWAPRVSNLIVLTPGEGRRVTDISVEEVWGAVVRARI